MAIKKYTMFNPCEKCKNNEGDRCCSCTLYGYDKQKYECPRYRIFSGLFELAETDLNSDKEVIYEKVAEQAIDLLKFFGYKGELRYTEVVNI